MQRRLRILGLTLMAMFALTAIAAASASAFTKFERETATTSFRGEQTEAATFVFLGLTVSCTNGTLRGMTGANPAATIETTASSAGPGLEYSHCTLPVIVNTHSCNYSFHASGTYDIVANGTTAEQTECNANGITFEDLGCKWAIKPQTGIGSITYSNAGTGATREVILKAAATTVAYTASGACINTGTFFNGSYEKGSTPVKGYTSTTFGTRAGLFIS